MRGGTETGSGRRDFADGLQALVAECIADRLQALVAERFADRLQAGAGALEERVGAPVAQLKGRLA